MKNFRLKGSLSGWGTYPYMFPDRTSFPASGRPAFRIARNGIPISQARPGSNSQGAALRFRPRRSACACAFRARARARCEAERGRCFYLKCNAALL